MFTELVRARAIVTVSGHSGAGKTSLVDELLTLSGNCIARPSSITTRARRAGEGEGEYSFVSRENFEQLSAEGELINRDEVHGNFYGIMRNSVETLYANGKLPIKEIHQNNLHKLREAGHLVLPVHLSATPAELTSGQQGGREGRQETDTGPNEPRGYTQVLSRHDGEPNDLAKSVLKWLTVTKYLYTHARPIVIRACAPQIDSRFGYNSIAPDFSDEKRITTAYFHRSTTSFWHWIFEHLMHDKCRYLEVGPGLGWLKSLGWPADTDYDAIDFSEEMRLRNIDRDRIRLCDASALCVNTGTRSGVLGSLLDPFLLPNFLLEVVRVLEPNGFFAGTSPAGEWALRIRGADDLGETTFVSPTGLTYRVASYCYTRDQLLHLLNLSGFEEVNIQTITANRGDPSLPPAVATLFAQDVSLEQIPVMHMWTAHKPA